MLYKRIKVNFHIVVLKFVSLISIEKRLKMKIFLLTNLFLFALLIEKIYSENFLEEQENVTETLQDRSRRSIYSVS